MGVYAIVLTGGRIGLDEADTLAKARNNAVREEGTNNVVCVRKATKDDISWVRGMGGWVPKEVAS